ncbi:hypothetical protein EDF56_1011067 [Novosphingobium sp. PhB165]|uniref:hypothetical protein n=1 Tax=Novosphingobium sp. PhB165 TaxID=2485105 RepID=UPI00104F2A6C|nr:hypothetical protein [Novosphingobium sp. PhB165]TCM22377.1 hypothetical protein EDF56_1011067 [Novosphingobium sp. PhB165]
MTPKFNVFVLALLLLVGLPLYWFQFDASAPDAHAKPLDIDELRTLAKSIDGAHPTQIRHELIGTRMSLHNQLAAGTGLRPIRTGIRAYELLVPGARPIVIDAGTTAEIAEENNVSEFDSIAQRRVDHEVAQAGLRLQLLDRPSHRGNPAVHSPEALPLPDLSDGHPRAVAPGIVAIPQLDLPNRATMYFVQLADGREFLFTGDVAQVSESWQDLRPPARTFADLGHPDKRIAIASWLMTIQALKRAAPSLVVIPGHDPAAPDGVPWGFVKS